MLGGWQVVRGVGRGYYRVRQGGEGWHRGGGDGPAVVEGRRCRFEGG